MTLIVVGPKNAVTTALSIIANTHAIFNRSNIVTYKKLAIAAKTGRSKYDAHAAVFIKAAAAHLLYEAPSASTGFTNKNDIQVTLCYNIERYHISTFNIKREISGIAEKAAANKYIIFLVTLYKDKNKIQVM